MEKTNHITWSDFEKVEMRVGTIVSAELFAEARKPAYKLLIDFGDELGQLKSSALITKLYQPNDIIGKQVVAVINFPPKQIANLMSQCLVLGAVGDGGEVTLLQPQQNVPNGLKIS